MSAKEYLKYLPRRLMDRAKSTPRVSHRWRTKSLTRLTSFYRNRFYEIDRWYKVRIPHKPQHPTCYLINPVRIQQSLEQRLADLRTEDPVLREKIDIGLPFSIPHIKKSQFMNLLREARNDPEMERQRRLGKLTVDPDAVEAESAAGESDQPFRHSVIAKHYGIYRDLFHPDCYFYPVVPLSISYDYDADLVAPVFMGNTLLPSETKDVPSVAFPVATDSTLYTLLMTNPDGNMYEDNQEILHWLVCNIPANRINDGDVICEYLQPLPLRGTGWHRMVFLLFQQDNRIDIDASYKKDYSKLEDRTFRTSEFYRRYEDDMTPAGLAFFQAEWDISCTECFHQRFGVKEPVYEYEWPETELPDQKEFAKKEPFNIYLDQYRDEKDLEKEVLLKRLELISPFRPMDPRYRYPNIFGDYKKGDHHPPSWLKLQKQRERLGAGRFKGIYENKLS